MKTISDIEAALHAAADRELEKLLEPLDAVLKDSRFRAYTKSEVITASGAPSVPVKRGTWAPAIVGLAQDALRDAVREDFRRDYVQKWLADVNRTISVVEDLEGRQ